MNRFCECLECDSLYESQKAIDAGVRAELAFTVCSILCQETYDRNAKQAEEDFKALEFDLLERDRSDSRPANNIGSPTGFKSTEKGTNIADLMKEFVDAQNK